MENKAKPHQLKKIILPVTILLLLIFMADLDPAFKKKLPSFSTKGELVVKREEPGFLSKTFCRGNQRPGFCERYKARLNQQKETDLEQANYKSDHPTE